MPKKKKLYPFDYHEALDRSYIITTMIDEFLLNLPAVKQNKPIRKKIIKAQNHLLEVYQMIGNIDY
jgi:hypothetical protein